MPELVAIAYPDEVRAGRASEELERSAEELALDRDAASVVICEHHGGCQLTTSRHPGATVHWSQFWGVLLDLILGGAEAAEIDPGFRASLRGLLRPGTSALLIAIGPAGRAGVLEALRPLGGTVLSCDLAADVAGRWEVSGLRFEGRTA
ncbi:MAG: hypothetical protein JSS97_03580 [Actinobacteria bacterium]|nr:hypothetical protein [Actinomycetota bacterium]